MAGLTLWVLAQMQDKLAQMANETLSGNNFSVGNDLVYLPDFKASWNELFKNKVYTNQEIAYCELFDDPILRYASTWAAKEAVYKAIKQLGDKPIGFNRIEIIREKPAGKPEVRLIEYGGNLDISLSISHDGDYAWAIAMTQRR